MCCVAGTRGSIFSSNQFESNQTNWLLIYLAFDQSVIFARFSQLPTGLAWLASAGPALTPTAVITECTLYLYVVEYNEMYFEVILSADLIRK